MKWPALRFSLLLAVRAAGATDRHDVDHALGRAGAALCAATA
jgi:hypothetical protein